MIVAMSLDWGQRPLSLKLLMHNDRLHRAWGFRTCSRLCWEDVTLVSNDHGHFKRDASRNSHALHHDAKTIVQTVQALCI